MCLSKEDQEAIEQHARSDLDADHLPETLLDVAMEK